ncbi:MAG: superoxide dismutase family protein [Casimicrobiaceae bacterium]
MRAANSWQLIAVLLAAFGGGCSSPSPSTPSATIGNDSAQVTGFGYFAPGIHQATANLKSKSNSNAYGVVTFYEKNGKVSVAASVFNLSIGPHSIYIHETGNCSSPNAASAGPVWQIPGTPPGTRRAGQLPELLAGTEGNAAMQTITSGLSIGDRKPTDLVGRSVVVHSAIDPDPKPQFGGVPNGWIACGVIVQGGS